MKSLPEGVGIAHDVKNCLQMILAASGLLENGAQDMERRKKYFAVIRRNVREAMNLLGRFAPCSASKGERENARGAETLLNETCEAAAASADENGVRLFCDAESGLRLNCEEEPLRRILFNLVFNAIRYTPTGGCVHVAAARRAGRTVLLVSDTGCGLSRTQREAFVRGEMSEGTGLSIVWRTARELGVRVDCAVDPGRGTTFALYLPDAAADMGAQGAPKNESAAL